MNILATICARGGSKGVQRKNLRELGGHTLLELAIMKAFKSKMISDVVVSTDDEEIAQVAKSAGAEVPFMRPPELASDSASKFLVFKHALSESEKVFRKRYDLIVDVDVSVPFTTSSDIENAINLIKKSNADSVVAAFIAEHNPYFNMMEEKGDGFIEVCKKMGSAITSRQSAPKVYQLTAGILVMKRGLVLNGNTLYTDKVKPYVMPAERSIMIDTELDFKIAEFMVSNGLVNAGRVK